TDLLVADRALERAGARLALLVGQRAQHLRPLLRLDARSRRAARIARRRRLDVVARRRRRRGDALLLDLDLHRLRAAVREALAHLAGLGAQFQAPARPCQAQTLLGFVLGIGIGHRPSISLSIIASAASGRKPESRRHSRSISAARRPPATPTCANT